MTSALYNRDILRLAASVAGNGRLAAAQGSADKRSPTCGSRVIVDVMVTPDGALADLGLDVRACALGQASAALMSMHAVGRNASELTATRDMLAAYLEGRADIQPDFWPGIEVFEAARDYPARHPSILLAFEAVVDAMTRAINIENRGSQA